MFDSVLVGPRLQEKGRGKIVFAVAGSARPALYFLGPYPGRGYGLRLRATGGIAWGIGDSFAFCSPGYLWCWVSFARAFLLGRLVTHTGYMPLHTHCTHTHIYLKTIEEGTMSMI